MVHTSDFNPLTLNHMETYFKEIVNITINENVNSILGRLVEILALGKYI